MLFNSYKKPFVARRYSSTLFNVSIPTFETNLAIVWFILLAFIAFIFPLIGAVWIKFLYPDALFTGLPTILYGICNALVQFALLFSTNYSHAPREIVTFRDVYLNLFKQPWTMKPILASLFLMKCIEIPFGNFFWFCWVAILNANMSITCKSCIEPNTFHATRSWLDDLSRMFHLAILVIISNFYPENSIYIVWAILPIVWCLGILPSFRIFVMVLMEWVLTLLGACPQMNNIRTLIVLFLNISSILVLIFVPINIQAWYPLVTVLLSSGVWLNPIRNPLIWLFLCFRVGTMFAIIWFINVLDYSNLVVLFSYATLIICSQVQSVHLISIFLNPLVVFKVPLDLFKYLYLIAKYTLHLSSFVYVYRQTTSFDYSQPLVFWNAILYHSSFMSVWLDEGIGFDLSVIILFDQYSTAFSSYSIGLKLLLVRLARLRIVDCLAKFQFWILMVKHFLLDPKERHKNWQIILPMILIISPISIIFSSLIDAPVAAIFGLPLLIISFPRPSRFWPSLSGEQVTNQDAAFYKSLAPEILQGLSKKLFTGSLKIRQGSVLVCRMESRILLIRCIESWFEGVGVELIGCELEPTSCHALEGTQVDTVLDDALIFEKFKDKPWLNNHFFHTLSPKGTMRLNGYSESKSVSTGILDRPDILKIIPTVLLQTLTYLAGSTANILEYREIPINRKLIETLEMYVPAGWLDIISPKKCTVEDCKWISLSLLFLLIGQQPITPMKLIDLLRGKIGYHVHPESRNWYLNPARNPIRRLAINAVRITVRLIFEAQVLGNTLDNLHVIQQLGLDLVATIEPGQKLPDDPTNPSDTISDAVLRGKSILIIGQNKGEQMGFRFLNVQSGILRIGSLNQEAVRAMWANQVIELLYLTNDDDERYSIQAHPLVLRNLMVQTARPPLGYPVWISNGWISNLPTQQFKISPIGYNQIHQQNKTKTSKIVPISKQGW